MAKPPKPPTRSTPYGDIPLIPVRYCSIYGKEQEHWTWDLDFQPPMPKGAVRGHPRRQVFCCDVPKYYYRDLERVCVECGDAFTFWAKEQKFWYEELQFNFASTAVRCAPCRKKVRSANSLKLQLGAAVKAAAAKPDDPGTLLALAETSLAYFDIFKKLDLRKALAAARRAGRLSKDLPEALYWEGRCHEAAGRPEKARALYAAFAKFKYPRLKALREDLRKR